MTCSEIELAVAWYYGIRSHLIVPNVSWGLGLHECDLLVVTKSGYAHEVEIKVSRADIIRDRKKDHAHRSEKIKMLWFAIPKDLFGSIDEIPAHAGVYVIDADERLLRRRCNVIRKPEINREARKLTDNEILHLGRLSAMRVWGLKKKLTEAL